MNKPYAEEAKILCKAIKEMASKPDNLENLECYLAIHFYDWLKKFANTPEKITAEIKAFAEMEI